MSKVTGVPTRSRSITRWASRLLLGLSALSLTGAYFLALDGTNTCNLSDIVLICAAPGFLAWIFAGMSRVVVPMPSSGNRFWRSFTLTAVLYLVLAVLFSHLQHTSVCP